MTPETTQSALRPDLLSSQVSTFALGLLSILALAAWVVSHRLTAAVARRLNSGRRAFDVAAFAGRVAIGTLALWLAWQLVARRIVLETNWSLAASAFIGALAIELVLALYAWERRLIGPRTGRWLLVLRVAVIAIVLLILAQPVLAWVQDRRIERRVVVLVDDSKSMQLVDRQMMATEKLDLAQFFEVNAVAGRPRLHQTLAATREVRRALAAELEFWRVSEGTSGDGESSLVESRREALARALDDGTAFAKQAMREIEGTRRDDLRIDDSGRRRIDDAVRRLREFADELAEARRQVESRRIQPVRDRLERAGAALGNVAELLPQLVEAADNGFLASLGEAERRAIEEAALVPRANVARAILTRPGSDGKPPLLDRLRAKYDVTVMRFGKSSIEVPGPEFATETSADEFALRTDMTSAFDEIVERVPAESLAGVLLLSDGRHNGDRPPDDVARAFGIQGSPVRVVGIGSAIGPKDAAFLKIESPESIYLGDRIKVRADVKADGMKGRQLKVTLSREGKVVDTQMIPVPENSHRTSVRLGYAPPDKGIFEYAVRIDPVEGELFSDNNEWKFETAVTDDRTDVLLVDGYPRWEFRYLRNLFYGRDKSVHLQYVLLNPDRIEGQDPLPAVAASAGRRFGEAEASRLPESPDEWLKFDVIIVGDVASGTWSTDTWEIVERCVAERGALLVVIAGPRAMPHLHRGEAVRKLLPVEYAPSQDADVDSPDPAFSLRLTSEGRNSPIMKQADSVIESGQVWAGLPPLMWRHAINGVKAGAEVLAFAEAEGRRPAPAGATSEERLTALTQQRRSEAARALIVTARHGLGKVAMLNFDQTWRLRYGTGDVHHHRFWGNLLRWGAGENLRAGTSNVRLGTDKLTYESGQPVTIVAKLTGEGFKPETDATVNAAIFGPDGKEVARRKLDYREGSSGIYEAEVAPNTFPQIGRYRVELTGGDVERLLRGEVPKVETHFTQLATINPVELGDLSLDREMLGKVAALSGGSLVEPIDADELSNAFGAESRTIAERRETTLWDNWILMLAAIGLMTTEWIVRRRAGVA